MIPAPDQLYVTPAVVELAEIFPLVVIQFNANGAPAVTFGKAPELVTLTVAVLVHPLAGFVTVTVYTPTAFTVAADVLPPDVIPGPAQLYVTPAVVELAETFPLVVVQFNTNGAPAVTFGKAPELVTLTVAVLVHPLAGLVTVTVYVPTALTVAVEVVPPAIIPDPAQL